MFPPYSDPATDPTAAPSFPAGEVSQSISTPQDSSPALHVANIEFSFILQSSLDAFDFRGRDRERVSQDLGLLHAIDERLSVWGWETPTGTKFIIVLDAWGRPEQPAGGDGDTNYLPGMGGGGGLAWGMKDGDLKPAFGALQTAYIRLLQNPFYVPDQHVPGASVPGSDIPLSITSKRFIKEVDRIGMSWRPGVRAL